MSKIRKIILILISGCFLLLMPPLMHIYNKPVLFMVIPLFLFVVITLCSIIVLLMYILYKYEEGNNKKGD